MKGVWDLISIRRRERYPLLTGNNIDGLFVNGNSSSSDSDVGGSGVDDSDVDDE